MKPLVTILITGLLILTNLYGQETEEAKKATRGSKNETDTKSLFIGFHDKNDDGVNDKFFDADGDGKNDVSGEQYPHKFEFHDKNKDKINDIWVDRDGDGVNDLAPKLKGIERKDAHRNILDVNEDGRNDITGETYDKTKHHYKGETWGFWDETKGKLQGRFIDEDGDGIDDRMKDFDSFMKEHRHGRGKHDLFIDEDGDGICDGRTDFLNRMGRHGRKDHHGRKDGGGHHH